MGQLRILLCLFVALLWRPGHDKERSTYFRANEHLFLVISIAVKQANKHTHFI